jgi:propanol-preferring alcohol dehydrogenase
VVAAGGQLMLIGLGGGTLCLRPTAEDIPPVPLEASARIPFWGTRAELREVLDLGRRGLLCADIHTFPLVEAAEAYERLRRGEIHGRAVIVP